MMKQKESGSERDVDKEADQPDETEKCASERNASVDEKADAAGKSDERKSSGSEGDATADENRKADADQRDGTGNSGSEGDAAIDGKAEDGNRRDESMDLPHEGSEETGNKSDPLIGGTDVSTGDDLINIIPHDDGTAELTNIVDLSGNYLFTPEGVGYNIDDIDISQFAEIYLIDAEPKESTPITYKLSAIVEDVEVKGEDKAKDKPVEEGKSDENSDSIQIIEERGRDENKKEKIGHDEVGHVEVKEEDDVKDQPVEEGKSDENSDSIQIIEEIGHDENREKESTAKSDTTVSDSIEIIEEIGHDENREKESTANSDTTVSDGISADGGSGGSVRCLPNESEIKSSVKEITIHYKPKRLTLETRGQCIILPFKFLFNKLLSPILCLFYIDLQNVFFVTHFYITLLHL